MRLRPVDHFRHPGRLTQDLGRAGTFWLFGFFALCSVAFGLTKVPETKARSLEEIEREMGAPARDRSMAA